MTAACAAALRHAAITCHADGTAWRAAYTSYRTAVVRTDLFLRDLAPDVEIVGNACEISNQNGLSQKNSSQIKDGFGVGGVQKQLVRVIARARSQGAAAFVGRLSGFLLFVAAACSFAAGLLSILLSNTANLDGEPPLLSDVLGLHAGRWPHSHNCDKPLLSR